MNNGASSLLLVTHVAIRHGKSGLQIDDQTAAGITQWCNHFDRITYHGIVDDPENYNSSSSTWVNLSDFPQAHRCELVALPRAYQIGAMLKEYGTVRVRLSQAVASHRYLCVTGGGIIGDWPTIAAREAIRQNRPYAVWLDRVEPDVVSNKLIDAPLRRRMAWAAARPIVEHNIRHIIKNSSVTLLQGMDTFDHYKSISRDPHCTYDTHTHVSDQIEEDCISKKLNRILGGAPINILYVGRAVMMKGPSDWLATLERLHMLKVPFRATWIGDGPELPTMRERLAASPIAGAVNLYGFETKREVLLKAMRESDVFLFCHKTLESPRCLIEALVSGCPLVGYETAYSRGLVQMSGGGIFADRDDITALADRVARLHHDRPMLARLIEAAAASGKLYNEYAVYKHRASLMKKADALDVSL